MRNRKLIARFQEKIDEIVELKASIPKTCVAKHRGLQMQRECWEEALKIVKANRGASLDNKGAMK